MITESIGEEESIWRVRASCESEGRRSRIRPLGKEERKEDEITETKLDETKK